MRPHAERCHFRRQTERSYSVRSARPDSPPPPPPPACLWQRAGAASCFSRSPIKRRYETSTEILPAARPFKVQRRIETSE
ncbi:hypothetical protein XELAEV_18032459mg [Xenopus laevis]|uniref:Uncharacterized protein n=1 Tax=Xenopus laevis TaxID=8355 RepID=A0A974CPJ2_XENLA|nr:hypothetical protein XELAEV_18032459mg [Xenopus laevis]